MDYENFTRGEANKFSVAATLSVVALHADGNQSDAGLGSANILSYRFGTGGDKVESRKGGTSSTGGGIVSETYYNHFWTVNLDIEFFATGGAGALALAAAAFVIPSNGSAITITDATDPQLNGTWIVDSAEKTGQVDNKGTGTITAHRRPGTTLALAT